MEIQKWSTGDLVEYARNPRKNNHVVDGIAAAIREFGFRVPILVKKDGTVIDGHLRLKAAKKLKMETVPVVVCDDMSEAQIKAFRISVNRFAELADWDDELLSVELHELNNLEFDLGVIGFEPGKLTELMFPDLEISSTPTEFSGDIGDKFQLLIEYDSEKDLQSDFHKFQERGMKCKIIQ
jgi:hypothetical protein